MPAKKSRGSVRFHGKSLLSSPELHVLRQTSRVQRMVSPSSSHHQLSAIIGTTLAVVVALVLFLTRTVNSVDAFLISLILVSITLVIQVILNIDTLFLETQISGKLRSDPVMLKHMDEIANCYVKLSEARQRMAPSFDSHLEYRINQHKNALESLLVGRIELTNESDTELNDLEKQLMEQTNGIVQATSAVSPDWWSSPIGLEYQRANKAAIERGAKVTRIFIVDFAQDEKRSELMSIARDQQTIGVKVRFLDRRKIDDCDVEEDFVIFTTKAGAIATITGIGNRGEVSVFKVTSNEHDISTLRGRFRTFESNSVTFEELDAVVSGKL